MIARALLGGGDLAGSRAIGVSLKIAWELEPSPRSGGQGPAAEESCAWRSRRPCRSLLPRIGGWDRGAAEA